MQPSLRPVIARNYAQALWAVVQAQNLIDTMEPQIAALRSLCQDASFRYWVRATLPSPMMQQWLDALASAGIHPLFLHFLKLLRQQQRLDVLPDVLASFEDQLRRSRQILSLTVVVARADAALSDRLAQDFLKAGYRVECRFVEDPSILGGMILWQGHRRLDVSLRRHIKTLYNQCMSTMTHKGA
jgi:ATP synthase F1 delta subunit